MGRQALSHSDRKRKGGLQGRTNVDEVIVCSDPRICKSVGLMQPCRRLHPKGEGYCRHNTYHQVSGDGALNLTSALTVRVPLYSEKDSTACINQHRLATPRIRSIAKTISIALVDHHHNYHHCWSVRKGGEGRDRASGG